MSTRLAAYRNVILVRSRFQVQERFRNHSIFCCLNRASITITANCKHRNVVPKSKRQFSSPLSTASSSNKPGSKKDPPTLQNLALASVLFGFVTGVFLYSMNSVGRGDGDDDPLAQLKAEAHEAQESAAKNRKLTPQEIQALESGMTHGQFDRPADLEIAVAAPADIATLEEEANLKIFRQKQNELSGESGEDRKHKKPWWRFGF